jgi:uncharacterized coiled-coil protein SlyX
MADTKLGPLRNVGRKAVTDTLDASIFTRHNFSISFDGLPGDTIFHTSFLLNPKFFFKLIRGKDASQRFVSEECPGRELAEPIMDAHSTLSNATTALKNWAERIAEEYRLSSPLYDEFEELRKTFIDELGKHVADPTAHFTKVEADKLREQLDSLASRFDSLQKENSMTVEELKQVKAQLNELKNDAGRIPKNAWYRAAGHRVFDWAAKYFNSKQGRELVMSTTKALLTNGDNS